MIEELIFVVQQHVFLFPIHDLQLTVVARVRKTGFDFRPSLNFQCLEIGKVIVAGILGACLRPINKPPNTIRNSRLFTLLRPRKFKRYLVKSTREKAKSRFNIALILCF